MENPVGVLILGVVAVGWIVLRLTVPAKWQEFGFLAAIVLALVPTMMGLRQDPMVQTVVLPIAGGLVIGDLFRRLVQRFITQAMAIHRKATGQGTPKVARENVEDVEARARRRARRARAQAQSDGRKG